MKIVDLVVSLAVTAGAVGSAYLAIDVPEVLAQTTEVAQAASCRMVTSALVAHLGEHGSGPADLADLQPYVDRDLTGYSLVDGQVSGPGCHS